MSIKKIPFSPPDITESEVYLVSEALRSGWITTGPKTKEFERLIAMCCQTDQAVCLNSATACMELILRVLGVGPGDEVITSAYTYTATASVTCHVGAKVVMVDTAPDSFEMDYDKLADAITEKTKVVLPVDLAGVVCDYDKIFAAVESKKHLFSPVNDIQKAYGRVIVLADAAHAFGAKWHGKMCGEIADFTSFSFHAVKNLTTAEGGALTWRNHDGVDNESLYKQFQLLSLHGQNKDALAKTRLGAWEYDIVAPYYKCNMTDVMAGIGLAQLKRYPEMLYRRRQIIEISQAFEYAHELGMATILWCYLRNNDFKKDGTDYHAAADLTGQANHIGVTIKADIVKQKLPSNNGGFTAIHFGKTDERMYSELATSHPIDLCRYQVANGYMGRVGLINSGGESHGESDLRDAVVTAVINKRAGGMGLISGRKAFQKPMEEGVQLLNTIQDVYLDSSITIA